MLRVQNFLDFFYADFYTCVQEMNNAVKEKVGTVKNYLVAKLEPNKIILFGSVVRKDKKTGFDIDILIVTDKTLSHRQERQLRENIDKIAGIYSVDLIFSDKVDKNFLEIIENTGMVIYEKNRG